LSIVMKRCELVFAGFNPQSSSRTKVLQNELRLKPKLHFS